MNNPYNYNLPVEPTIFFGSAADVTQIIKKLFAPLGDSVALIGGRRMGKTSLLEAIRRTLEARSPVDNTLPLPLLFDLSLEQIADEIDFFQRIAEGVALNFDYEVEEAYQRGAVGKWFGRQLQRWNKTALNQHGHTIRLVLLLDECEQVVEHQWTQPFYAILRGLLVGSDTRNLIKVVMAGSQRFLTQVRENGSPLRNVLDYHTLRPFDTATTIALISRPHAVPLSEPLIAAICEESGGHPFLTQYLMYTLWEEYGLAGASIAQLHELATHFPQQRPDFTNWYEGWGPTPQTAYKILSQAKQWMNDRAIRAEFGESVPHDLAQGLNTLHYHGLILQNENHDYRVGAEMFRRWFIRTYVPQSEQTENPTGETKEMTQFTNGYALLIGVNENQPGFRSLPDVLKDITALRNVLTDSQRCAYQPENIEVITGKKATKQGIINGVKWLADKVKQAGKSATGVIYYSGHGSENHYLIPYDVPEGGILTHGLKATDFAEAINQVKADRLFVVLDCCHAGGMGMKSSNGVSALPAELFAETDAGSAVPSKGITQLETGRGRAVLSSSTGTQYSYIRSDGNMSVFTYHLIEVLTGKAEYQVGATEVLVSDVMSYVEHNVPATARSMNVEQTPTYYVTGNFPIASLLGGKGVMPNDIREENTAQSYVPPITHKALDIDTWVKVLNQIPTMQDRDLRNEVIGELPDQIQQSVKTNLPTLTAQLRNLVKTCNNYPNGLSELIEAIRTFENDSFQMRELDRLLQ